MDTTKHTIVAIDIAKETLEVKMARQSFSVNYQKRGLKLLEQKLKAQKNPFVVCEATGGYERPLLSLLHHAKIAVSLVSPNRVRAFAQSEGIKAKTDRIDAAVLLRFGQEKKLRPTLAPDPEQEKLAALLDRRSQLSNEIAREKNRLEKATTEIVSSIKRIIGYLTKEVARIEKQIKDLVEADPKLKSKAQIIGSVSGVGKVTTWMVLAFLPEITQVNRNQLAALAGVAPFNRDSGKKKGKRCIYAGRAKIRKCLFMAASSAAQHNPVISPYVKALKKRGKPHKCALTAAMRKILIHIQSLLKNHQILLAS